MEFDSSRILAGIGSILTAIGIFIPLLTLVGLILLLIGLKGLSDTYREEGIFRNALYAVIIGVIGLVTIMFAAISIAGIATTFAPSIPLLMAGGVIGTVLLFIVVFFVILVLEALFYKKSLDLLATKSGEKLLETAGLLLLIGAVLTIIIVGLILIFIAWIIAAVAFFSLKPPQPAKEQVVQAPPALA